MNINNEQKLAEVWQKLNTNETNNTQLNKNFIMKSITSKSILSTLDIQSKIKKELIMHLVSMSMLLYITVTGMIHTLSHKSDFSAASFFIVFTVFIIAFYGFYIGRQYLAYKKMSQSKIGENASLQQLKSNYNGIKSYLKFDKKWTAIVLGIGAYLIFSHYTHTREHTFPMVYVMLISILAFSVSLFLKGRKNKKKYGPELDNLQSTLDRFNMEG